MTWLISNALMKDYESLRCSLEPVVESSEDTCSAGVQSAQSKSSHTQLVYLPPDKMTEFSRLSRFGMTFEPLTESLGEDLLTWFLAGFHARTYRSLEKAQGSTESEADSGQKWRGSFAKYDQHTFLWKTHQHSLLGGLDEYSETWPKWGLMRDGECWEQSMPAHLTEGCESGLLPTPCTMDSGSMFNKSASSGAKLRPTLGAMARHNLWPTPVATMHKGSSPASLTRKSGKSRESDRLDHAVMALDGGQLNPTWVEWLMGWLPGWTDLKPLAMDRFQQWLHSHGKP